MFSTDDKIAALKREIAVRRAVYKRRVSQGVMRQSEADREIALMVAILADYETGGQLVPAE